MYKYVWKWPFKKKKKTATAPQIHSLFCVPRAIFRCYPLLCFSFSRALRSDGYNIRRNFMYTSEMTNRFFSILIYTVAVIDSTTNTFSSKNIVRCVCVCCVGSFICRNSLRDVKIIHQPERKTKKAFLLTFRRSWIIIAWVKKLQNMVEKKPKTWTKRNERHSFTITPNFQLLLPPTWSNYSFEFILGVCVCEIVTADSF